jgi:glycosyltransferase 2 family protein
VRGPATRRTFLTVRSAVDHTALMVLAARESGANAPQLLAVTEVGPYAALIAFRNLPGHSLKEAVAHGDQITDAQLCAFWRELAQLQSRKVVHRALTWENLLITDDGKVALLDLGGGEIAASDLAMRLDTVQLLVTLALVADPERAVATAVEVLGPNAIVDSLPLLQRIALSRNTRRQLKQRKGLLHDLRTHIIEVTPADPDVEEIKLERLSGRTVVAIIGGSVAAYVIATQFTQVNFGSLAHLNWAWRSSARV